MAQQFTPEEWMIIKQAFLAAMSAQQSQRQRLVQDQCGQWPHLHAAVTDMIANDAARTPLDQEPITLLGLPCSLADVIDDPRSTKNVNATQDPVAIPASIGPYRVLSLIGEGAFGSVFLAEQQRPARQVAIKLLRPGLLSRNAVRRFAQEPEIMARLQHPAIARVLAVECTPDVASTPYFVLEYIDGLTLIDHAQAYSLSCTARINLFLQVCEGIQFAHSRGVLHRDIKPANILVEKHTGHPKILDFGVARLLTSGLPAITSISTATHPIGTLAYMSPEQASGTSLDVDIRSDVYSLGSILYELLAGQPPHSMSGKLPHECMRILHDDEPRQLGQLQPECRGDIEIVVQTAMAKDRTRRYSTVSELAADLRRLLANEPIAARRPSLGYQFSKIAARNKSTCISICVAGVLLAGAVTWLAISLAREQANYRAARNAADVLLNQVISGLGTLSGTLQVRQRIINDLRDPVERFAKRDPHDTQLQFNLARLRLAESDIELEHDQVDRALDLRKQALEILDPLIILQPENIRWLSEWSIAAVKVGDIVKLKGNLDSARRWYQSAFDIDEECLRLAPSDISIMDQRMWGFVRLANIHAAAGNLKQAETLLLKHQEACEVMLALMPDRPATLYAIITGIAELILVRAELGHNTQVLEARLQLVRYGERLLALSPLDRGFVRQHCMNTLGAIRELIHEGQLYQAQEMSNAIDPIVERFALADPESSETRGILVTRHHVQGNLSTAHGDFAAAVQHHLEAVRLLESRMQRSSGDQVLAGELAMSCARAATALAQANQRDAAIATYNKGLAALEAALVPSSSTVPAVHSSTNLSSNPSIRRDALFILGNMLLSEEFPETNQPERAIAIAEHLISASSDKLRARELHIRALHAAGQHQQAIDLLKDLVSDKDLSTPRRLSLKSLLDSWTINAQSPR